MRNIESNGCGLGGCVGEPYSESRSSHWHKHQLQQPWRLHQLYEKIFSRCFPSFHWLFMEMRVFGMALELDYARSLRVCPISRFCVRCGWQSRYEGNQSRVLSWRENVRWLKTFLWTALQVEKERRKFCRLWNLAQTDSLTGRKWLLAVFRNVNASSAHYQQKLSMSLKLFLTTAVEDDAS